MPLDDVRLERVLALLLGAGHLARSHARYAGARQLFEQLRGAFPDRASPWLGLALVEIDRHAYATAAAHCRAALALVPDHALARAWLGVCQFALGDTTAARNAFRAAQPGDSPAARDLATAMLQLIDACDRTDAPDDALLSGTTP